MNSSIKALYDQITNIIWNDESIGPPMSKDAQFCLLEKEILEEGQIRSNVRGKFIHASDGLFFDNKFRKVARTSSGQSYDDLSDLAAPLHDILFRHNKEFQDLKTDLENDDVTPWNKATELALDQLPAEYRIAHKAMEELDNGFDQFKTWCIRTGRIIRFKQSNGRFQITDPFLREDNIFRREYRRILTGELPASLLSELLVLREDRKEITKLDPDAPVLEKMVAAIKENSFKRWIDVINFVLAQQQDKPLKSDTALARRLTRKLKAMVGDDALNRL